MTFTEANKLALDGNDDAFDIKTADHLCWNCTRNKRCYACLRYCGEIVSCNYYKPKITTQYIEDYSTKCKLATFSVEASTKFDFTVEQTGDTFVIEPSKAT